MSYCRECGKAFTLSERIRKAYNDLDDNEMAKALLEVEELVARMERLEK